MESHVEKKSSNSGEKSENSREDREIIIKSLRKEFLFRTKSCFSIRSPKFKSIYYFYMREKFLSTMLFL